MIDNDYIEKYREIYDFMRKPLRSNMTSFAYFVRKFNVKRGVISRLSYIISKKNEAKDIQDRNSGSGVINEGGGVVG